MLKKHYSILIEKVIHNATTFEELLSFYYALKLGKQVYV